jgi:membrane-bound lytic murein transglycosylase D
MTSTRSNKSPYFHLTLLATLLSIAGCASLQQPKSADEGAASAVQSSTPSVPGKKALRLATASDAEAIPGVDSGDQIVESREYHDLWERIRTGYTMPPLDSHLVGMHERWFANNPEYIENMVSRARYYLYYIVEEVEKRGMPMEIALLPAIESAYKPHAYSRARAVGLWQFIQSTGRVYGLQSNWWYDGRRDVVASTQAALDYLEKLYNQFNDWQLALAAYNCGEGKVERLVNENRRKGLPTDYLSLKKLPRETKNYVPKLMAIANIVTDPAKHGLKLASIPNTEFFARVETEGQIDLGVVAKLTDMPVDELFMINPGYQRWITDPKGPHALLVPADKKDALVEGLSKLSDEDRVQWARHEVKRGDTMSRVAGRYGVTVDSIRTTNNLGSNHLSIGQNLLIPVSANKLALASVQPPAIIRAAAASPRADGRPVKVVHRVRSGESLWSIARKYRVYIHQLREWNLMDDGDALRMGQRIFIWTTRSSGTSAARHGRDPG